MAKQVTETVPYLQPVDTELVLKKIRENIIAFKHTKTADEMRLNVNEHRRLNDQLEEIIDQRGAAA